MTIPPVSEKREQIQFALSELMSELRVEILSPVAEKNPKITNTFRPASRPGWGQYTWRIWPHMPIEPGKPVVLRFEYQYSAEKAGFVLAGSEHSFFASGINSAWYPELEEYPRTDDGIPLRGLRSIGEIRFRLPDDWSVYSPGKRTADKQDVKFIIERPIFFAFAAARYTPRQISVPTNVTLYELNPRGDRMQIYLQKTVHILDVLTKEFGPYPYPAFAIVEVPVEQAGSTGFAGASLDGFILATTDFLNQEFNTAYYGHEIGHQWWGNLVRTEGPEARWLLSEAMAQYGSLRAVEELDGPEKAEVYRRRGYPGYSPDQSGFGYLLLSAAGLDLPLTKLPRTDAISRGLADSKGFFVFEMLSREIGREKFAAALRSITTTYAGRRLSWGDFQKEVTTLCKQDLSWFFQQWFNRTGAPEIETSWQQKGTTLRIHMKQQSSYFRIRVPVKIIGKDQQQLSREFLLDAERKELAVEVPFAVVDVKINPNFDLLAWTPEYKEEATALAPYTRASTEGNYGDIKKGHALFEEGLRNLPNQDPHGLRFLMHYGFGMLLFDENDFEQSRKQLEIALGAPVLRRERLPWAYLTLAQIADKQNDPRLVCSRLQSVFSSDRALPEKTGAAEIAAELSKKYSCNPS